MLTGMGSHAVKTGDLDLAEHLYQQSLMLLGGPREDCTTSLTGLKSVSFRSIMFGGSERPA